MAFILLGAALWASLGEDIEFYDETLYLSNGVNLLDNGPLGFTWGPGYSDLYFLLSQLVRDPINLYVVGRAMAAVILVASVWLATRLHARRELAWTAAAVMSLLPVTYVLPGVGGPAAGAALLAVAVAFRIKGPAGIGFASALLWLAASARPEFVLLAIPVSVWAVLWLCWGLMRRPSNRKAAAIALLAAAGAPIALVWLHGSPLDSGNRSWVAFIQHYPLHPANEGNGPGIDYQAAASAAFPGATSLPEALSVNGDAVLRHMALNIAEAPRLVLDQMFNPYLSLDLMILLTQAALVMFIAGSLITLVLTRRGNPIRGALPHLQRIVTSHAAAATFTGALVLWSLVPFIVIYPRPHYQPFLIGLVVTALAMTVSRLSRAQVVNWLVVLPVVVMSIAFFAQVTIAYLARSTQPSPPLITSLRAINSEAMDLRLLTGGDGSALLVYAPRLKPAPLPIGDAASFPEYLDSAGVDVVNVTPALSAGPWAKLDGFTEFVTDPSAYGFIQVTDRSPLWMRPLQDTR